MDPVLFACLPCLIHRNHFALLNFLRVGSTPRWNGYHMWSCPDCGSHGERLDKPERCVNCGRPGPTHMAAGDYTCPGMA